MGKNERRAYLEAVIERYQRASKKAKTAVLDEFCKVCDYHRKHAIRLLNRQQKRPRKRPGRKPIYRSTELLRALKRIWSLGIGIGDRLVSDQMCSKRLVAAIPLWLPFYEGLSDEVRAKLLSISAATIDRLLASIRARTRPKGLGGTKPGSLLRNQIPIRTHPLGSGSATDNWDITQPGFMEADTVAHCWKL